MLTSEDWRFVAAGNAHLVYRYVGGDRTSRFRGMVLKLPVAPGHADDALLRQHHFIKRVVVGDAPSTGDCDGTPEVTADCNGGALTADDCDEMEFSECCNNRTGTPIDGGVAERTVGLCSPVARTQGSNTSQRQKNSSGLVNAVHLPMQLVHLFDDRYLGLLRQQGSILVAERQKTKRFYDGASKFVLPTCVGQVNVDNLQPHPAGTAVGVSSFALLERDLVTPPLLSSKLFAAENLFPAAEVPSTPPAYVFFCCELKPKTGLPAVLGTDPENVNIGDLGIPEVVTKSFDMFFEKSQPVPSRFTLQQRLKRQKGIINTFSFYEPEVFFARTHDIDTVLAQCEALFRNPQNNWRLFIDGARVIWDDGHADGDVAVCGTYHDKILTHTSVSRAALADMERATADSVYLRRVPLAVAAKTQSAVRGLKYLSLLFGMVIQQEVNLFERLLVIHALCEGQQFIAQSLRTRLLRQGVEDVDTQLLVGGYGATSLKDLVVGLEREIASSKGPSWVFRDEEDSSAEVLFALRIQRYHYTIGLKILAELDAVSATVPCAEGNLVRVQEEAMNWLYRFLVGRTFLDCSVMMNLAFMTSDASPDDEQKLEDMAFIRMCSFEVDDLLSVKSREDGYGTDASLNDTVEDSVEALSSSSFHLATNDGSTISALDDGYFDRRDRSKESGKHPIPDGVTNISNVKIVNPVEHCDNEKLLRKIIKQLIIALEIPIYDLCQDKSREDEQLPGYEWRSFLALLQRSRGKRLTAYYRLNVIDLDLKQPSKIPQWAEQLRDALKAFTWLPN